MTSKTANKSYRVSPLYTGGADREASTLSEAFEIGKRNGFSFAIYCDGEMIGTWCPMQGRSVSLFRAMA